MIEPASTYVGHDNLEVMEDAVNYNRWLVDLAARHLPTAGRILDFGAGTGTLTRLLRSTGLDVTAFEPDSAQAEQLATAGIPTQHSLDSIDDGSLAGVATFNVLEHIEDDEAVLGTLWRKLRAGGRMFIYVPAFPLLYSAMDRKVGHVRRYRRKQLVQRVTRAGFTVTQARHADSIGFAAALAYRFLAGDSGELNRRSIRLYDRFAFPVSRHLDILLGGCIGKNLMVAASRP